MTEVDLNHGIRKVLDISNSLDIGLISPVSMISIPPAK